ncbi:MAG: murein biosynthesis integral membrane protein MurJ [Gammaproteobacteria bacterium]
MSAGRFGSLSIVGGMTLLSRLLGLVREVLFARFFGAGLGMDVFVVAFQIPNFLRRLFAEGAFSQAFVPVVNEYRQNREHADVRALSDRVAGTMAGILLLLTIVGVIAAPVLIWLFGSGSASNPEKFDLAVYMLRITFPYIFFISLTAFAGGLLNTYDRFGVPAFTPVILNLCLISATLLLAPTLERPIVALAWGVFAAGLLQLAFQIPFLHGIKLLPNLKFDLQHEGVRRIMTLMLPAIFGASVAQVNLLIDRKIAWFMETGSISWLYFSDRLLEFPLGLFAIALGTVILPSLSRDSAANDTRAFSHTLDWALRWVVVIALPAACGLFMLAGPMISTVFQYGEYGAYDVRMARVSLMAYALGLMAFSLIKVLIPGFFARQDTRTPVRIGIIALVFNIVANGVLVLLLQFKDIATPHAGLALTTALAAWVNALLLLRGLRRNGAYRAVDGWPLLLGRVVLACVAMVFVLRMLAGDLAPWLEMTAGDRITRLGLVIVSGACAYGVVLLTLGLRKHHLTEMARG